MTKTSIGPRPPYTNNNHNIVVSKPPQARARFFSDIILAAGFSTLYLDRKSAKAEMTASSTITTIEKLRKGEQVQFYKVTGYGH
jgi:hypothetical protein